MAEKRLEAAAHGGDKRYRGPGPASVRPAPGPAAGTGGPVRGRGGLRLSEHAARGLGARGALPRGGSRRTGAARGAGGGEDAAPGLEPARRALCLPHGGGGGLSLPSRRPAGRGALGLHAGHHGGAGLSGPRLLRAAARRHGGRAPAGAPQRPFQGGARPRPGRGGGAAHPFGEAPALARRHDVRRPGKAVGRRSRRILHAQALRFCGARGVRQAAGREPGICLPQALAGPGA